MGGENIDQIIFHKLNLTQNRANHCIYQGVVNDALVIRARATDDILVATPSVEAYKHIVTVLK